MPTPNLRPIERAVVDAVDDAARGSSHTTEDLAATRRRSTLVRPVATSGLPGRPRRSPSSPTSRRRFPPLEDPSTGTRVGIGVATGADDVYLTDDPDLVEPRRAPAAAAVGRHRRAARSTGPAATSSTPGTTTDSSTSPPIRGLPHT